MESKVFQLHITPEVSNEHSHFLFVYFTFAYYLLLAPFKFRRVEQGKYEVYEWLPQKLFCAFASALGLVGVGARVWSYLTLIERRRGDPLPFFLLFWSGSSLIFHITIVNGFWTRKKIYLGLIKCLDREFLPWNPFGMESHLTIRLILSGASLACLSSSFLLRGEWSLTNWLLSQLTAARNREPGTLTDLNHTGWTTADILLAGGFATASLSYNLFSWFGELLLLFNAWTLWAPTSGFVAALRSQVSRGEKTEKQAGVGKLELEVKLGQFESLKRLSSLIEQGVGDSLLFYIGHTSFFYAVCFDQLILTENEVERMILIISYCSYLSILLFSAEIVRKMHRFKAWLFEEGRWAQLDESRLAVLLDDLQDQRVGFSANGVFTLNYGFVGPVVSLLITYFIIQLQSNKKG